MFAAKSKDSRLLSFFNRFGIDQLNEFELGGLSVHETGELFRSISKTPVDPREIHNVTMGNPSKILKFSIKRTNLNQEPNIVVNTIYAVKGGEADNVIMFSDLSPAGKRGLKENINEVRKVFYTGMTRAKTNLYRVKQNHEYAFKELYA